MIYTFGPPDDPQRFQLDAANDEPRGLRPRGLRRGTQPIRVEATGLRVLFAFIQRPNRVFSNSELANVQSGHVEPDQFAKHYVMLLRKKLGDESAIVNERTMGYTFAWRVSAKEEPPSGPMVTARLSALPNLPQNHIRRDELVARLRELVLASGEGTNIAVTAVRGMGGVGKTVLANELCRDPEVSQAFPDGIAWVTIGRESNSGPIPHMKELARSLGGEIASEGQYRVMLRNKAALIVIDDVWSLADVNQLLAEAPHSRFLFTTRDESIARAAAARIFKANILTDEEARALLHRWAGDLRQPEADRIIRECDHLALAIAVIGPYAGCAGSTANALGGLCRRGAPNGTVPGGPLARVLGRRRTSPAGLTRWSEINAVAVTPDGAWVAAACIRASNGPFYKTLKVWERASAREVAFTSGEPDDFAQVGAQITTPDGKWIVAVAARIVIRDAFTGQDVVAPSGGASTNSLVSTLEGHTGNIVGGVLVPGTGTLITASEDGTIRAWAPPRATAIATLTGDHSSWAGDSAGKLTFLRPII